MYGVSKRSTFKKVAKTGRFSAYNVPHLEKNPTANVYRPQVGELAKVSGNVLAYKGIFNYLL